MTGETFKYQVTLSFVGEDGRFAQALSDALHSRNVNTFQLEYEQIGLSEKNFHPPLQEIDQSQPQFWVVLISEYYLQRYKTTTPTHTKWESLLIQPDPNAGSIEYLLPIKLGNVELPWPADTDEYLDGDLGAERIADILVETLRSVEAAPTDVEITSVEAETAPSEENKTTPVEVEATLSEEVETSPVEVEATISEEVETSPVEVEATISEEVETSPLEVEATISEEVETSPVRVEVTLSEEVETSPQEVEATISEEVETSPVGVEVTLSEEFEISPIENVVDVDYTEDRHQTPPVFIDVGAIIKTDSENEGIVVSDEILEIFVESAAEAMAVINENFPRWKNDFNDSASLAEFRRAFHSLKGDGRMVKAEDISELAWSVENMLNRLIHGYIEPNAYLVALLDRVHRLLPTLIETFGRKQANPHPCLTEIYKSWSNDLSHGELPDDLKAQVDHDPNPGEVEAPTTNGKQGTISDPRW